jgi:5-methylcytosine-specific restriction endonuclease McrA
MKLTDLPPVGMYNYASITGVYSCKFGVSTVTDLRPGRRVCAHEPDPTAKATLLVWDDEGYEALCRLKDGDVIKVDGLLWKSEKWQIEEERPWEILAAKITVQPEEYEPARAIVDAKVLEWREWDGEQGLFVCCGEVTGPEGEVIWLPFAFGAQGSSPIRARLGTDWRWKVGWTVRLMIQMGRVSAESVVKVLDSAPVVGRPARLAGNEECNADFDWEKMNKSGPKPKTKRSPIPPSIRRAVMEKAKFRCQDCGANPQDDPWVTLEIDHRVPVALGGDNSRANLQVLCRECNAGKGAKVDHKIPTSELPPHLREPELAA